MLLNGLNHVAILTNDTDRLHAFFEEVLEAMIQPVGLEREVCVANSDAQPGVLRSPGAPAARYQS